MIEPGTNGAEPPAEPPKRPALGRNAVFAFVIVMSLIAIVLYNATREEAPVPRTIPSPDPGAVATTDAFAGAAGCAPVRHDPDGGGNHITPPERAEYESEPPTSGLHYGGTAPTGAHTQEVQPEFFVHNLEHGHVVITYDQRIDEGVLSALQAFAGRNVTAVVVTPRDELGRAVVAVTSWRRASICRDPGSPDAVTAFLDSYLRTYRGISPEGFLSGAPL